MLMVTAATQLFTFIDGVDHSWNSNERSAAILRWFVCGQARVQTRVRIHDPYP